VRGDRALDLGDDVGVVAGDTVADGRVDAGFVEDWGRCGFQKF